MSLVVNMLTSQTAANFVQNSASQVLSEGCLKAAGRPVFTLLDKSAGEKERKYSATKEFLYQSLSMVSYFALIFPIRKNGFKLLKFFPQLSDCEAVKAKTAEQFKQSFDTMSDGLAKTKIKGAQELISIGASALILSLVAPRVVNKIVHPVMDKISKKEENKINTKA